MEAINYASFTKLWKRKFGELPENYKIVHIDGNHKNNDFLNLSISGLGILDDNAQAKLRRMADHFYDIGLYTKGNYCHQIAEYITELENKLNSIGDK